ncbi:MAG: hypothetical protein GY906_11680 [bacterium]|nr:hypothetical protein [bacterium]
MIELDETADEFVLEPDDRMMSEEDHDEILRIFAAQGAVAQQRALDKMIRIEELLVEQLEGARAAIAEHRARLEGGEHIPGFVMDRAGSRVRVPIGGTPDPEGRR